MPEKLLYLLLALAVVGGFLLVETIKDRIRRRRDDRRLERSIAEYLRQKAAGKE
jgi:hypothetical protein